MNTERHKTARQKKTLLKSMLYLFFAIGLSLVLYPAPTAVAATFTVNSTADAVDVSPGDGVCETGTGNGVCTLRAAIQEANALSGADTIILPAGTYTYSIAMPFVTDSLTITGDGAGTTVIDGNGTGSVMRFDNGCLCKTAFVSGVTIKGGNTFFGGGVAIVNYGTGTLREVTVRNNSASSGGAGLFVLANDAMVVENSTVSGNSSGFAGGGVFTNGAMTLTNVTISGNSASDGAGFRNAGTASLTNVTINGNTGIGMENFDGPITFKNTIVANNSGGNCSTRSGPIVSDGHNLDSGNTCGFTGTGDLINTNPQLGPLQDNGGPTFTHALLTGSPAIDAGNPAVPGSGGNACAATDQRGFVRPIDGNGDSTATCDIGAFEFGATSPDGDGDGYTVAQGDCNDNNASIHPGAAELCNGVDDNCDGTVDEGFNGLGTQCTAGTGACQRTGTTVCTANGQGTECNATAGTPGTEVCNGIDDDCNGEVDAVNLQPLTQSCYSGSAGTQGVGVCHAGTQTCSGGTFGSCVGEVTPAAAELCNGVDDNCNGQIDEGVQSTFYQDADGDGFGTPAVTIQACSAPAGYVANNTDCNDSNAAIHPNATELCNGVDDNCNGQIDETFAGLGKNCSVGVGACQSLGTKVCSADGTAVVCSAVPGTPGTEICGNGIDEDCNGADLVCAPPPSLIMTTPNGGESWKIGQSRALKWKSTNVSGNVTVELLRSNGGTWVTLFSNTPNDGQENWVVTEPATTQARIRISSVVDPSVFDVSDAVFTIR